MSLYLAASLILILFMFRQGGGSSPVAFYAAYAGFFLFGPMVTYLIGGRLYVGTRLSEIATVALWYFLAVVGLALADLFWVRLGRRSGARGAGVARTRDPRLGVCRLLLLSGSAYALYTALTVGVVAASKRAALDSTSTFHYRFLFLEAVVVASFWFFRDVPALRRLYYLNAGSYVVYCLSFRERDFIFVFFTIMVVGFIRGRLQLKWAPVGAVLLAYFATQLFLLRSGRSFSLDSLLNQGSTLFVDSYLSASPAQIVQPIRSTYVNLLLLRPPTELGGTGQWFKLIYSSTGVSGYGFSLIGEARYNVGLVGIVVLFAALGLTLNAAFTPRRLTDPLFVGPGVMFGLMYGLRGDLRAVVVSLVYVAILHFLMTKRSPDPTLSDEPVAARRKLSGVAGRRR